MHEAQTYWDADKSLQGGILRFERQSQSWTLGGVKMREDLIESTPASLVLRAQDEDDQSIKVILRESECLTPLARSINLAHVCPYYKGTRGKLLYVGALYIFRGAN